MTAAPPLAELSSPLPLRRKLRLSGEVLASYCRVRWWLWRHDPREVIKKLQESRPPVRSASVDPQAMYLGGLRLGRAVSRTLRLLPTDSRCLVRSLVLTRLLARRGVSCSLVIGVRSGREFAAHAWVEHAGKPLLDPGGEDFRRLVEM